MGRAFLDCQTTFGTVTHRKLMKKLKLQGEVRRDALKWIESCLREQRTIARDAFSSWEKLTCGVPQVSMSV